jgi:hypothetical protein
MLLNSNKNRLIEVYNYVNNTNINEALLDKPTKEGIIKDFLKTEENFDIFDNNVQALPDIYIYELMLKLLNTQNENVLNLKEKLSFLNLIYVSKSGNFNLQINQKINQL